MDKDYLQNYLVHELGIEAARDDNVFHVAVETMRAMNQAYVMVANALNVATGHPDRVKPLSEPKSTGFKIEDNR